MDELWGKEKCLQYLDDLESWVREGEWFDMDEIAFRSIRSYVKEYADPRQTCLFEMTNNDNS